MSILKGTVAGVKLNQKIEKKDGGSWEAHILNLDVNDDILPLRIGVKSKTGAALASLGLKKGDLVTVLQEKNDKGFDNVENVVKGHVDTLVKLAGSFGGGGRSFDSEGATIGNAVSNATNIALKLATKESTVESILADVKKAAAGIKVISEGMKSKKVDVTPPKENTTTNDSDGTEDEEVV